MQAVREEKYRALKTLMSSNMGEFLVFAKKINPDQLDYQALLNFLDCDDFDVRNGAQLLLYKIQHKESLRASDIVLNFFQ